MGLAADAYSREYLPGNGLLDRDLPDTRGVSPFVTFYRDLGDGPVRELRADMSYAQRYVGDGRVQRRTWYSGGSVELRQQIRVGLWFTDGIYRPVGPAPGLWSSTVNDDHYWTGAVDFNTRSSRLGYGIGGSSGQLGGGDYNYTNAYAWARPTATTFVSVSSERLSNFGTFSQTVATAGWDITPRQGIVGRYINAFYGNAYRLAYSASVRKNVDFFAVYDQEPNVPVRLSAKVVMTIQ